MNNMNNIKISQPVVNLHELTNGIENYYSNTYKMNMTGKPIEWGYHQTLPEITNILKNTSHSVTSRLAHYHLVKRNDSMPYATDFYRYLNENFYIISCRRNSVFENALSWGIHSHSKQLNVYSHNDKIKAFGELYKSQISIPKQTLIKHLDAYKNYIEWSDTFFNINDYFIYEEDMPTIETFINKLDCFNNVDNSKWNEMFGMDWRDWNLCHRLLSDLGWVNDDTKCLENIKTKSITDIVSNLPLAERQFLDLHAMQYLKSSDKISEMVDNKLLVTGVPIKLQTLVEKKMIIKNFNDCALVYNEWADKNGYPIINNKDEIINQAYNELKNWYSSDTIGSEFTKMLDKF
jgi:hypothetical protein